MGDTYGYTQEEIRDKLAAESKKHRDGKIPANSEAADLQSLLDQNTKDKATQISKAQASLPLPEDPPGPSDFNSADARTVNVGSGGTSGDVTVGSGDSSGLREPSAADSAARVDGDEWKTGTAGLDVGRGEGGKLPNDAVTRDKREHTNTTETRN